MTVAVRRGHPIPDGEQIRILFVFAWLGAGGEETEVRLLAPALDPRRYRIDAVACFCKEGSPEQAHERLEASGVAVDRRPYSLSFEDTVAYLAQKLPHYDVVVSQQDVADVYPALERLPNPPPLIERGSRVSEAESGPKHFTHRYVGACGLIRDAAARRMPGRPHHALAIPTMVDLTEFDPDHRTAMRASTAHLAVVQQWQALFEEVATERRPARRAGLFPSFFLGGFECSTQRMRSGKRLDLIAATDHDLRAADDYRQLAGLGIHTVRDSLRWHLIETTPGCYDWSSFLPMLRAAKATGTRVIWDVLHYGLPDGLDVWSPDFVRRFAAFARAAARVVREESEDVPLWCPINEISYFSWAGGEAGYFHPFATGRGFELKVQLARAAILAMEEMLAVDPRTRFVHCEPLIHVVADPSRPQDGPDAEGFRQAQFQAFDLISGRMWPQLGGREGLLDIVGANYYFENQWIHDGAAIDIGHPQYRPFRHLLVELHARYGRPLLIAETSIEGDRRASWLAYVGAETRAAMRMGVPVEGLCLYPVMDYPGWDNDRECLNGLLSLHLEAGRRGVFGPLVEQMLREREAFAKAAARRDPTDLLLPMARTG